MYVLHKQAQTKSLDVKVTQVNLKRSKVFELCSFIRELPPLRNSWTKFNNHCYSTISQSGQSALQYM